MLKSMNVKTIFVMSCLAFATILQAAESQKAATDPLLAMEAERFRLTEAGDVDAIESLGRQRNHGDVFAVNFDFLAGRTRASNQANFTPDVFAVVDDVDHYGANGTGCSNQSEIWLAAHAMPLTSGSGVNSGFLVAI